jgi:hypothetical protein
MKKIFTTVIALAVTSFGFAQSIRIFEGGVDVTNSSIYDTISANELTLHEIELENVTSNAVNYKVNRSIINSPAYFGNVYFCTGTQCYSPNSSITWTPSGPSSTIAANSTLPSGPGTYGISAHYDADTVGVTVSVLYRVFNTSVAGDTSYVTIHYIGMAVGVQENTAASGTISSAYPNPASTMVSFKYEMDASAQKGKLVIFDMLGNKVKDIELNEKQGTVKVDVSEMNSGIYFYSFMVNNKAIVTKKLIVSSK